MCGIVGRIAPRGGGFCDLKDQMDRLRHRGPDAAGQRAIGLTWADVSVGMTRLAITDRSQIAVPYAFTSVPGVTVAFNGEVYNWRELRSELADGTPWETECDVEVLARAWRRWGERSPSHLNGMFAFVVVDTAADTIFLCRDRAGEKPLYWTFSDGCLCFASEIKALPPPGDRLVETDCIDLETFEFDCLEETPFAGVFCAPPGSCLHMQNAGDLMQRPSFTQWWELPIRQPQPASAAAEEELSWLLADAVRMRMPDTEPFGTMLSGGLDSAIIHRATVQHGRPGKLYNVSFPSDGASEPDLDAFPLARKVEPRLPMVIVSFGKPDLLRVLPQVAWHLDTPATWTAVCDWFLMRAAARDGLRIMLSGEGADELFGGYARYRPLWHIQKLRDDPFLSAYGPTIDHMVRDDRSLLAWLLNRGATNQSLERAAAVVDRFFVPGLSLPDNMARIDFYTTMQVLLRMADRMAAAFSIENRSPFLDHRVMEYSATVSGDDLIGAGCSKCVLRTVARIFGVHEDVVGERTKRGLAIPYQKWFGNSLGTRGVWNRSVFRDFMVLAWRKAFHMEEPHESLHGDRRPFPESQLPGGNPSQPG